MMKKVLQTAANEIDAETGFRCRSVYTKTEASVLHNHDYYEIFLTLSDNITHIINDTTEILSEGTLIFIRKQDTHYFKPSSDEKLSFINLAFTEEIIMSLFSFLSDEFPKKLLLKETNPPKLILNKWDASQLTSSLDRINSIPIASYSRIQYEYRKFLYFIFTQYFYTYEASTQKVIIPVWLRKFSDKITDVDNFSLSKPEIVAVSGKSREYLSRSIKKYYGLSLSHYINDIRLNYISNKLINSDIPIIDLFYSAGFENLNYAYSLFKTKFGITPRTMRESADEKLLNAP